MTRTECEDTIIGLLEAIKDVYKVYAPEGSSLSISVSLNGHLSCFNSHWEDDCPINVVKFEDGEVWHRQEATVYDE